MEPGVGELRTEGYQQQERHEWPARGQHILAHFDDDTVVVYQAYKPEIAAHAVASGRFEGCLAFSEERMTWIKTNFLWMMFRCGWATKHNQERVLAIWLRRSAFDTYLSHAKTKGSSRGFGTVRLQWDPDHFPDGKPHPYRRAVQLGLKNVSSFASGEDIVQIRDITDFVRQQAEHADGKHLDQLVVVRERVYVPRDKAVAQNIQLDKQ